MPPLIATAICGISIAGLFYLDRGEKPRVSKGLVLPALWLFLNTTHPLSWWLGMQSNVGMSNSYVDGNPFDRNVIILLQVAALVVLSKNSAKIGAMLRKN